MRGKKLQRENKTVYASDEIAKKARDEASKAKDEAV